MDASRQTQFDANNTGASMYLSFDSSISSAAFRTLETTMNERSIEQYNMEYEDITPENSQGIHQDSTLEALDSHTAYLEANRDKDAHLNAFPNALPKRVLQQFNVVSSTPTKEQLLRSVEVVRGSGADRCMDLRRAFMDIEEKDKENTLPVPEIIGQNVKKTTEITITEEQQTCPEPENNVNNLANTSISSITSRKAGSENGKIIASIEKKEDPVIKMDVENSAAAINAKQLFNDCEKLTKDNKDVKCTISNDTAELKPYDNKNTFATLTENKQSDYINEKGFENKICQIPKSAADERTLETIMENKDSVVSSKNVNKTYDIETSKTYENTKTQANNLVKKDSAATKNSKRTSLAKKPICEPDLLTNRPSRIATNANKRLSVNNVGMKANLDKEITTDIPKLMNKVLRFTESANTLNEKTKIGAVSDTTKSNPITTRGRASILPSTALAHAEKRPFAYTQRMSILVKTTLNSPARKIARRSCAIAGPQNWKSLTTNVNAPTKTNRKSMLPMVKTEKLPTGITGPPIEAKPIAAAKTMTTSTKATKLTKATTTTTAAVTSAATKSIPTTRKSIYAIDKSRADSQKSINGLSTLPTTTNTKLRQSVTGKFDNSFVCNVCGSKFSIKSLLEAHKRSHESDGLPPAFIKKTASTASSSSSSSLTTTIAAASAIASQAYPSTNTQTHNNGMNQCKYCDKKFALIRALHIHLLQNCAKIPPKEKRKLTFHVMDHVEKAQLPAFFHANTATHTKSNLHEQAGSDGAVAKALPQRSTSDLSSISVSSTDSLSDKRGALAEITMIAKTATSAADSLLPTKMAPPSARSVKKSNAHTGVYRTPNKSIMCHICKISFKTIMDSMQHNIKVHFKNNDIQKLNGNDNTAAAAAASGVTVIEKPTQ